MLKYMVSVGMITSFPVNQIKQNLTCVNSFLYPSQNMEDIKKYGKICACTCMLIY